ncbi:hypothetical protein PVAP13_9NG768254 [Panicum virgatum]|uniref:Uncharacterized protein n=1 Tax=Panicum virgatum TaxID=38727 RepID=A0A8T0N4E5_PANVG|nr:hypothetical protein PVAP13_9NG768254 [Panicum virgatum]
MRARARGWCGEVLEACAFRYSVTAFPGDFAVGGGAPGGRARGGLCWCCNGSHALPPPMPFGGCGWCILPSCGGAASARRAGGRGSGRVMCAVRGIVARTGTAHQWAHGARGPRFTGAVDALRCVSCVIRAAAEAPTTTGDGGWGRPDG